jgi:S1-C subfamily serine protease
MDMNDDTGEPETHLGPAAEDPAAHLDDRLGAAATDPDPGPGEVRGSAIDAAGDAGTSGQPVDHTSELTPADTPPTYPAPASDPAPPSDPAFTTDPAPPAGFAPTGVATPATVASPAVPFSYPPPAPPPLDPTIPSGGGPLPPTPTGSAGRRGWRGWLPIALVAALIGAGVGAGVTALTNDNGNDNTNGVTIHESNASPGAAVLSGNVTIPELVNKVIHAVVSIDVKTSDGEDEGTGMIITSDGEVVTNNHVIELYTENGDAGTITVTEYGQTKSLPTTLIGYDQTKDLALLKINNASGLPTVTFGDSQKAVVGDAVVAIGNALGLAAGTPTVTQGIVSALGRSVQAGGTGTATENLQNLIQTDAAINPGNSGGPLIDTSGQVIGMNTAVAGSSSDGTSSQNIGFAIPIDQVEALLPQLQKGGASGNGGGYLGVDITTLTPSLRQQYGFTPTQGAVVLSVAAGSPAAKAGVEQGDVIVEIDGTAITSSEDLQKAVEKGKPGQSVTITYYVGDNRRTTTATLGSQPQSQQTQTQTQPGQGNTTNPFGGGGFPGFGNSGSTGGTP